MKLPKPKKTKCEVTQLFPVGGFTRPVSMTRVAIALAGIRSITGFAIPGEGKTSAARERKNLKTGATDE